MAPPHRTSLEKICSRSLLSPCESESSALGLQPMAAAGGAELPSLLRLLPCATLRSSILALATSRLPPKAKLECYFLNNCGLPATYSAQSSLMIRSTSSELKLLPSGCLLPSRPMRKIPEYGSPGYGVKAASVGSWTIPCGEMLNWSRLTRQLAMIVSHSPNSICFPSRVGKFGINRQL